MLFKSKNSKESAKSGLNAGTALAGALFAAAAATGVAHAQTAPAAADTSASSSDEAIIVTGSHITRPGFTSSSPISTVTAEDISRQQPVNVEELLRSQPQFSTGNAAQVNNGGSGATTLDLRGLTEPRTLPLVDGHRMPGFDPNGLFDVSAVPLGLLERVDVVTGGASAVYGSDAVAGVVNFILNPNFQGLAVRADHSWNDLHDSGDTNSAEVTMGAGFDDGKGNVSLDVAWMDRQPVFQVRGPAALAPGNSSFSTPAAFDNVDATPNGTVDNVPGGTPGTRTQLDATGQLATGIPYQGFDFNGQNLYQQPQTRWTATALAHYDLTENIQAYARLIYNHSTATTQLASTPVGVIFDIPLDNPFLSAQASNYLATHNTGNVGPCADFAGHQCVTVNTRWRAVDVGPRESTYLYQTFQALGGFRGDIGNTNWNYDLTFSHGETSLDRQQNNDVNQDKMQQALYATSTTTCADPSGGCSPLNLFDPTQPVSAAAASFIGLNLGVQSRVYQDYFTGVVSGDLGELKSPFAQSPIGVAIGGEYRREEVNFVPDFASQAGISPGFGPTLPVHGHYDVSEVYAETVVPLVENAPFAESINLELGYRSSDYSSSGRVESYKYGGDWTPTEGYRFRAMFQRAVRAPNLSELFGPLTSGTGDLLSDPCAGVLPANAVLFGLCQATGAPNPTTLSQPTAGQVNNFSGGNTNLIPETADTVTVGFVLNPPMLRGLRATVDYFDIQIDNAISIRPLGDITDGCYNPARNPTADATIADCAAIQRDPSTGLLDVGDTTGITQVTQNIGSVHVEGVDYSIDYTFDMDRLGSLTLGIDGTHLMTTSYKPSPGGAEVDCLGFYGKTCGLPSTTSIAVGGPVPEDKFIQHGVWSFGDWELGYRWRYLSSVDIDAATGPQLGDLIGDPDLEAQSSHIKAFNYFDLSAAWQVNDTLRINAAVTNITNEEAPFVFTGVGSTPFNSGNTYPSTYDVLGRVFTIGASAKF